eukprot:m.130187 g.130187  ORF g.130187 m.130187 type:complete len:89 (+) comp52334_c0_seq3:127-393(+)
MLCHADVEAELHDAPGADAEQVLESTTTANDSSTLRPSLNQTEEAVDADADPDEQAPARRYQAPALHIDLSGLDYELRLELGIESNED